MKKIIRILYDGMSIRKNPAGVGYVAINLLKQLSTYSNLEFIVYTRKNVKELPSLINSRNIIIHETKYPFSHFEISRHFFEQFELPKLINKYKPNIFHLTNSFGAPFFINKHKLGLKIILTLHDLIPLTQYYELMSPFERILYKLSIQNSIQKADAIVIISKYTAKDLIKYFPAINKNIINIIPNGIELFTIPDNIEKIWINVRNKYHISKNIIFYLGGFAPRKNVLRLLKAYHLLIKSKKIDCQLVLSGRFSQNKDIVNNINQIKKYIHQNNLQNQVKIIDYVDYNEKIAFLTNAKFFVYPSLYEGFGLPVLEALSVGTPVLTSKNSAMEEVAEKYALYCNPFDKKDIADKIMNLIKNYSKYKKIAESAKINLIPKFNWKEVGRNYYQIYKKLS